MEHIKLSDKAKQAIETVLSKGDRAIVCPMECGGIKVKREKNETVYVQK